MAEVNGPYIIETFEYVRDIERPNQGVLILTTAGGDQFGLPTSVNELKAKIDRLRRELEDL